MPSESGELNWLMNGSKRFEAAGKQETIDLVVKRHRSCEILVTT